MLVCRIDWAFFAATQPTFFTLLSIGYKNFAQILKLKATKNLVVPSKIGYNMPTFGNSDHFEEYYMLRKSLRHIAENAGGIAFIGGSSAIIAKLVYENQREHKIYGKPTGVECADFVRKSTAFHDTSKPVHGTMTSRRFVENEETGEEYFAKGAHSTDELLTEFMIGNFAKLINPRQPETLILEEPLSAVLAQFNTLSHKHPNAKDVENFVRSHGTDKLKKMLEKGVTVEGLGESLAFDLMVGKYYDTKLANMVVIEAKDGTLHFVSIDHERAALSIIRPESVFTTNPEILIHALRDLSSAGDENKAGLASDPRAFEFAKVAKNFIDPVKIIDFYKKTASVDTSPLIDQCNRLASQSGMFSKKRCSDFEKHFKGLQSEAAAFVAENGEEVLKRKPTK